MITLRSFFFFFLTTWSCFAQAQLFTTPASEGDTLRGGLRAERWCYDVHYYDLDIEINPTTQAIAGKCAIHFTVEESSMKIQIDLFANMQIDRIEWEGKYMPYQRMYDAVFIEFETPLEIGSAHSITIYYQGQPRIAKFPPWDGGFTWSADAQGKHWVGVSCQEIGASLWWPTKEDLSDEPDSMRMHYTVPAGLICVGNGRDEGMNMPAPGKVRYNWFVSYPINNYNVTLNIADYVHFDDIYTAEDGTSMPLDYYVLKENEEKARIQFEQVKPMLKCYEQFLGKYPFWNDGYALVETPYLGMEHQGAIAYGNQYKTGYLGLDRSGMKLDFDYIIIHETGHEWWGNSVSCQDLADMWIHESFCTYSEAIYVECLFGYDAALVYANALRNTVGNTEAMAGTYGINRPGSGDMYVKGMLFLNTLRHVVANDELWWKMIKDMADNEFKIRNTNYDEVVDYFNKKTGLDLKPVFRQYVRMPAIPKLELNYKVKGKKLKLKYRWVADVKDFNMPIDILIDGKSQRIYPTTKWKKLKQASSGDNVILVDKQKFYVRVATNRPPMN